MEQQTKKKKGIGSGQIALHGTSPTGDPMDPSLIIPRGMMVTVRTAPFFTETNQNSALAWMDGTMFLVAGSSFTLSAKSQSVQQQVRNYVEILFVLIRIVSEGSMSSILAITGGCAFVLLLCAALLTFIVTKRLRRNPTRASSEQGDENPVYGLYYFADGEHIDYSYYSYY